MCTETFFERVLAERTLLPIEQKGIGYLTDAQSDSLLQVILWAQDYIREARMHRVYVSIRDVLRAEQLYRYISSFTVCVS